MTDGMRRTLAALGRYTEELLSGNSNGVKGLQNIMTTCALELRAQRELGIEIPEPEPARPSLSWDNALRGMQAPTKEEDDGKVSNESNS